MTFTYHAKKGFHTAWFSGASPSTEGVGTRWHAALAGRGYMLDLESGEFQHRTVPMLKQDIGADTSEPGEVTLNQEGAWRRSASSWHLGAGQEHRDLDDSVPTRFLASKGVDVWTRGQLSLLAGSAEAHDVGASGTTAQIVSSGGYLYYLDDQSVYRTDLTSETVCTGTPAADALSVTSNGTTVYVAYGSSGVYSGTATALSQLVASTSNLVAWAKGRILSANGKLLDDLSTGTAVEVLDHNDSGFEWTAVADGVTAIFAAGNSGDRALIYRVGITADGSALDAPVVAARLPDGETIHSMTGYLGVLVIGTNHGFRVAAESDSGNLTMGPLIDLGVTVSAFATSGKYVWFGWTNYDSTSTGTGRMDLSTFTSTLVPAYASDVMVTGQGTVDGLAFLNGELAIGVAGVGIYKPSGTVTSGTVEMSRITYGILEEKTVRGGSVEGLGSLSISVDGGTYTTLDETDETERGRYFDLRLTVTGTVRATTLYAFPAPRRTRLITLPLLVHSKVKPIVGTDIQVPIDEVRREVESLAENQRIVTLQEGQFRIPVKVEDYVWVPHSYDVDQGAWNGTFVVRAKEV